MKKEFYKTKILIISIIIVIVIGIIVSFKYTETQKFETAITNILNEQYEEAQNILNTITESDKRNNLMSLCDAYIEYNSGNIPSTYRRLEEIKNAFDDTLLKENVNIFLLL